MKNGEAGNKKIKQNNPPAISSKGIIFVELFSLYFA
jgi:hypothetical protein